MMRFAIACLLSLVFAASCGGGMQRTCQAFGGKCPNGGTVEACSDGTNFDYQASDGTDFPCNGSDCSAASMMAVQWCAQH